MANVIKKIHLVKSDPVNNNNKFWNATLFDDNSVCCTWGRIGDSGQSQTKSFSSKEQAEKFLESKSNDKKRSGRNGEIAYKEIDIIDESSSKVSAPVSKTVTSTAIKDIAQKQIKVSSKNKETLDLINYFVDLNIHNITSFSNNQIQYNYDKGQFQTALGLIGQGTIDSARDILAKIADCVFAGKYNDDLMDLTRNYLMSVPQNIGRQRLEIRDFWSTLDKVKEQNALLDGLQASLVSSTKSMNKDVKINIPEEQIFNTELDIVTDKKIIDEIFGYYNNTKSTMHSCYNYRPKKIWAVKIDAMQKAFEVGKKIGNVVVGFHSSGSENFLSLLKSGLVVRPPSAAHISGKLLGSGIYCAPIFRTDGTLIKGAGTKALNYGVGGVWGGRSSSRTFMLLLEMAMGKFYLPRSNNYTSISYPVTGYDSTWAYGQSMGGDSGLRNDEAVVYKDNQVNIKYLIEFEK